MPTRPKSHSQRRREAEPQVKERRGTTAERGYGYRWQKARDAFLRAHPLCLYCQRQGRTAAATLVDHSTPHKGDMDLFWRRELWVPCCDPCHQSVSGRYDGGHGRAVRARDGFYVPPRPGELL